MLDSVLSSLLGGEVDITVETNTQTYSGGRPVNTYAAPVPYKVRTVIDGPNSMKTHEDSGSQKTLNRHFYFHGQPAIFVYDRITYQSIRYESRGVEHRPEGNFTYVYGKALERLPDVGSGSD